MKVALLPVLAALLLVVVPTGRSDVSTLVGTVGPDFTIGLTDAGGAPVSSIPAGRYELLVRDLSSEHNFVLGEKATGERPAQTTVEFVGERRFTVDLRSGLWVYACSPHFQTMNGQLVVTAPSTPPSTAKRMRATVTSRRVSLVPTRVAPGSYLLTVSDHSATRGFRLLGRGLARRTGVAYVGKKSWRLRLRAGSYRFGDQRRLTGRLVVR